MTKVMKWMVKLGLAAALAPVLLGLGAVPALAQSVVRGEVIDAQGKPFPGLTVIMKNEETGQTFTLTTDAKGHFQALGVRAGIYQITLKQGEKEVYKLRERVQPGPEPPPIIIDFKKLLEQQDAAKLEEMKKQEEEEKSFENMKKHFDAGIEALGQVRQLNQQMRSTPRDQQALLQEQANQLNQTAVTELQAARDMTKPDFKDRHTVLARLAEAYDNVGKTDLAVAAYQEAISLQPDIAGYYNNYGNALAKLGKLDEAKAAYEKSAQLDPPNAGNAYLNYGIVLRNLSRMKEAVEPLKKATQLNPNNPLGWFLLGSALVASVETKQEGVKLIYIWQPGTSEALQKYLDLAPTGQFAADAQAMLEAIRLQGGGVDTKVRTRKGKGS